MTGLIARIVGGLIIAVVVGVILVALLGPILRDLNVPIADTVGGFFVKFGWLLGVLAGLWWAFFGFARWSPPA